MPQRVCDPLLSEVGLGLSARLDGGGSPQPIEALLFGEIANLLLDVPRPAGVDLPPVIDRHGTQALVAAHHEAFGGDHSTMGRTASARSAETPDTDCQSHAGRRTDAFVECVADRWNPTIRVSVTPGRFRRAHGRFRSCASGRDRGI